MRCLEVPHVCNVSGTLVMDTGHCIVLQLQTQTGELLVTPPAPSLYLLATVALNTSHSTSYKGKAKEYTYSPTHKRLK